MWFLRKLSDYVNSAFFSIMTSLVNEFMQIAQNYSDLLEGTDWDSEQKKAFVPTLAANSHFYSDLLEDTDWD